MGLLRGHSRRKESGTVHSRVSARLSKPHAKRGGPLLRLVQLVSPVVSRCRIRTEAVRSCTVCSSLCAALVRMCVYVDQSRSARAGTP